jgi:predicted NBD/HSP70 family sugar kinase
MLSQSFLEMRNRNAVAILQAVRGESGLSRADIARMCDLARSTVSSIVDELIQNGSLLETGSKTSNRGRRPVGLAFNPSSRLVAGISIDNKEAELVLVNVEGALLCAQQLQLDSDDGLTIANLLAKEIEAKRKELRLLKVKLGAIGLAIPGPVPKGFEENDGAAASKYRDIRKRLASKFRCDVIVDSNTNMAALSEVSMGLARANKQAIVVRLGHEVRSAIIVNQKLLRGAEGQAGELGHSVVPGVSEVCHCGRVGCINAVASERAILQTLRQRSLMVADLDTVISYANQGNSACRSVLADAGVAVGYGIATCINVFAPNDVIVTGKLVTSGDIMLRSLKETVANNTNAGSLSRCNLLFNRPDKHAEALGASLAAASDDNFLLELVADDNYQLLATADGR